MLFLELSQGGESKAPSIIFLQVQSPALSGNGSLSTSQAPWAPAHPKKGQGSTLSVEAEEGIDPILRGRRKIIHPKGRSWPCSPGTPVSEENHSHTLGDPQSEGRGAAVSHQGRRHSTIHVEPQPGEFPGHRDREENRGISLGPVGGADSKNKRTLFQMAMERQRQVLTLGMERTARGAGYGSCNPGVRAWTRPYGLKGTRYLRVWGLGTQRHQLGW